MGVIKQNDSPVHRDRSETAQKQYGFWSIYQSNFGFKAGTKKKKKKKSEKVKLYLESFNK